MRKSLAILVVLLAAGSAHAAPVATNATLTVDLGFGTPPITLGGGGSVGVTGSTVFVPAGLVSQGSGILIPVTATTAIDSLRITRLTNLSGTFSIGGVTNQRPSELCTGAPGAGEACNHGGGIGGAMALTGSIYINIIPGFGGLIPINLGSVGVGQGGSTSSPFEADAALWTTGTASVATASGVVATHGAGSPLLLVSPTYFSALGNQSPIVATLTLTNVSLAVPESSLIVLLSCAGLAYVLAARR